MDQPIVHWKEIFDGEWLKDQVIFGWPWYILEKMAIIYAMQSMISFITNPIIKFYNAFSIRKAIGKQASITKMLLAGIFGIFSQTLTQQVAQIQEYENHYSDDNNAHHGNNNYETRQLRQKFRRHSTDSPHKTDHNDNNEPIEVYVHTNYKHYNTTIRSSEKRLQLRTMESSPKKEKPLLPERKYKKEPFKVEQIKTISENTKLSDTIQPLPPQLITPPPAYQCPGTQSPLPSASQLQQHATSFNDRIQSFETTQPLIKQCTPYEIPKPTNTSTNTKPLIPTVKTMERQNSLPIDFEQLKLTANKMHNRSHSLDIINNEDQPHTNEVTYCDTHSTDTYEL